MLRKENVCCEKYMGGKDPITLTFPNEESTEQTVRNRTPESDFMAVAVLTAQKSRDPSTQVGACIVRDDKVIVAVGHNQMPNNHNDRYTWVKEADDTKYLYVCHAELNAILSSTDVRGCTIYVTLFPCNDCAKLVIEAGVKKVIYLSDKYSDDDKTKASKKMLQAKNINLV
ncbi:deoxycytidylate deaminase-like [Boleophthalmus pectinirostris]|uniref:deoxycytidylate deaminase-like n=1 Tax=Boleophthalmus pectinirostris TaxID=150288 RepID=UPI00242E6162|nr:deoxycytidylate deaminase-like [Boleophthalmus pectinirostris]